MVSIVRYMTQQERINFLLTNRVPRYYLTRAMGWYSRIENRWLTRFSILIWKVFADDLDLSEAKTTEYKSLRECFIRELKAGARKIDNSEAIVTSPCDAIVGANGKIDGTTVYQAKGFPYELSDLIPNKELQEKYRDGSYVTLRLKSSMYHRFHAPINCKVEQLTYVSGDTWNVNPVALKRIEKLYCKNERAIVELHTGDEDSSILMVPVAAILVASMKFHCIEDVLDLKYKGPNRLLCNAHYEKGDEMGYFQHGSTIILFTTKDYQLHQDVSKGHRIYMGQALFTETEITLPRI